MVRFRYYGVLIRTRKYEMVEDGGEEFPLHRLIAVAEYGFGAVAGNDIHHKSGVGWDNRPSNLEPIEPGEHAALHSTNRDNYEHKDTPYRDESLMRQLYDERGMSTYDIADELDTSRTSVIRWLEKHGIERRPQGQPPE